MKLALASTFVGLSRAARLPPREEAAHQNEEAASSTSTRSLAITVSGLAEGFLGSAVACDPNLPAETTGTCYIDAGILDKPTTICDPEFCLPRYECTSDGSCQPPEESEPNPFQDWCSYNANLCAYESVSCDRHAGEYFQFFGSTSITSARDCKEPLKSCSISNCCDDAMCTPDIPPASDLSLSEADCGYHSKRCEEYYTGSYDQYGYTFIGNYLAGTLKFMHCRISEGCCTKETQEERDLCNRVHECNHNANYYLCAGEATCTEFAILGYKTDIDCISTRLELSSCPFRECCQDAEGDMDKVRECVYKEDPAPGDGDEPEDKDTACLVEEDCAAAASRMGMEFSSGLFSTSGCFSKKNKAYFSPGTEDEMTKADLPGVQERIYCDGAEANARPDPEPEITLCLTESECDEARKEGGMDKFLSGDFPTHGCFKKSGKAYWGGGGSSEEISKEDLPGAQERIYCRGVSKRSSIVLSKASAESEMIVSGANVASLGFSIFFAVAAFSSFR